MNSGDILLISPRIEYGVPNGTKLRELWLKIRFLYQRNH
jgi:hypothetical protein